MMLAIEKVSLHSHRNHTFTLDDLIFGTSSSASRLSGCLVISGHPIPVLLAVEVTQFRVLPLLPIVVLRVGVSDRRGSLDGGGVRRAELEAKVSAMKRGDVLTKASGRGLPSEEVRLCLLEDIREESMVAAL